MAPSIGSPTNRRPSRGGHGRAGVIGLLLGGLLPGGLLLGPVALLSQEPPDTLGASASAPAQADPGAAQEDSAAVPDTVPPAVDSTQVPAPIPDGQAELDERNRAELRAIFDRVRALSGIDISVAAGVVTLSGEVPDAEAAASAIELAQGREGVVYVDDTGLTSLDTTARIEDVSSRLGDRANEFVQLLPLLLIAAIIIALFCLLAWGLGRIRFGRAVSSRSPFLGSLIQRLLQFTLVITGLVIALELLDATALVGAVVGTAGLAGLALGFAFKDIAENYLAGIILSLRYPFAKSDLVAVGGHEGKVVRLTGRETILMTQDGNHVQIPNATVFRETMTNYTRNPLRRFAVDIGVHNQTILSEAQDIGVGVLRSMSGVVNDPRPQALVHDFGASTMTVRFTGWVDQRQSDFLRVRSEAIRLLKVGLEEAGIELPEPEFRLHMPDVSGWAAGAAAPATPPEPATPPPTPQATGIEEPPTARPGAEAGQRDVSVDKTLDEQIEADRRAAQADDEEDLLEDSAEPGV